MVAARSEGMLDHATVALNIYSFHKINGLLIVSNNLAVR